MSSAEDTRPPVPLGDGAPEQPEGSKSPRTRAPNSRTPLERPWVKMQLIRELAQGDVDQRTLAKRHNVSDATISRFKQRYADRIEQVRADLDNEFAGLWIAQKQNRVAAYEQDAEELADSDDPQIRRLRQNALRSAAEELGHLRQRVEVEIPKVQIEIVGTDTEQL